MKINLWTFRYRNISQGMDKDSYLGILFVFHSLASLFMMANLGFQTVISNMPYNFVSTNT